MKTFKEFIVEISKPTLKRYVKKAADSIDDNSYRATLNHVTAQSKVGGPDSNDEPYWRKEAAKKEKKVANRKKGISKAIDKLTESKDTYIDTDTPKVGDVVSGWPRSGSRELRKFKITKTTDTHAHVEPMFKVKPDEKWGKMPWPQYHDGYYHHHKK